MEVQSLFLGIVYDVLFVLLILVLAWRGQKQGFVSGLLDLVCTAVGIFGGAWVSNTWALRLYREHIGVAISKNLGAVVDDYSGNVADALAQVRFLPASVRNVLIGIFENARGDAVPRLVAALEPMVLPLVQVILFLICCGLVGIITRLVARSLKGVNVLPLVGSVNRVLGLVLGGITGVLACWLITMALWFLNVVTAGDVLPFATATLDHSIGYRFLANFNLFLS